MTSTRKTFTILKRFRNDLIAEILSLKIIFQIIKFS